MPGNLTILAPSSEVVGGVQAWLDYLVPGLQRLGWKVCVALPHGRHSSAEAYLDAHPLPIVKRLANRTGSREGRLRCIERVLAETTPDIALSVNLADGLPAVARFRHRTRASIRGVAAVHGFQRALLEDLRTMNEDVDAAIAPNRLIVALLHHVVGIPESRAHYAPCGVRPVAPSTPRSPRRGSALRLIFVGRLSDTEKRVLDLPEIMESLQTAGVDSQLTVVGDGPEREALSRELGARHVDFEMVGEITDQRRLDELYSQCSALLITSASEAGPLVAWEAMLRRVAVVSANYLGRAAEAALIHDVTCLSFRIGDASGAAQQIARLTNTDLFLRLTEAAYNLARSRYTIEASTASWAAVLEKILAHAPLRSTGSRDGPPSGRLDLLLGQQLAEHVRLLLGREYPHSSPGGEWPHAYGDGSLPDLLASAHEVEYTISGAPEAQPS